MSSLRLTLCCALCLPAACWSCICPLHPLPTQYYADKYGHDKYGYDKSGYDKYGEFCQPLLIARCAACKGKGAVFLTLCLCPPPLRPPAALALVQGMTSTDTTRTVSEGVRVETGAAPVLNPQALCAAVFVGTPPASM